MKIFITSLFILFTVFGAKAQWTPLSSGTTANLNDVDFYDANNGVIVGDSGKILITVNGGLYWTASNFGTVNVTNVKMISPDTIVVSYLNNNNNLPAQSVTHLAGALWIPLFTDSLCFRGLDTESDLNHKWISVGSSLISTIDRGQNWDTLYENTCNTNNIFRLHEIDGVYNGGGLISGFTTYSASMIRSEDSGNSFHPYDPFSFPNSDALTAFDFPYVDTGYIFMNQYVSFAPGPRNSVIKVYDFQLTEIFPGDSAYTFNYAILDTTVPAYINDARMLQSGRGFAIGEDGNIYETNSGGTAWTQTYTNGYSLNKISFPDDENGYAVGDNGTLLKYSSPVSTEENVQRIISAYPNPASSYIIIHGIENENYLLSDLNGKIIQTGQTHNGRIELSQIAAGCYFVNVNKNGKVFRSRVVVM